MEQRVKESCWRRERKRNTRGGRLCLVSAAAGLLDNTLMMAIGYYERYYNSGDVRAAEESRPVP